MNRSFFSSVHGLLCGAALLAAAPAGASPLDAGELPQRYAGEYRFVGGTTERESIPAALERSVDGMFFISRGIAYDRLLHVCEICSSYRLGFTAAQVTVGGPCQLSDVSPADGSEVDHRTKSGDTSKLSQRFVDGALVQYFRGEEGARRVVWTLAPDGVNLAVHVTISSKHLPHDVDYTLSYKRVTPPASDADAGPH
jgi:hypothetical protein